MSELEEPPTQEDLEGDGEPDDASAKQAGVVGRMVESDEGAAPDEESQAVALETDDASTLTAEEAAMHVTDEP